MTRSRASAKAAGTRFERLIADWLRDNVSEFIDRRAKTGSRDKGDLGGIRDQSGKEVVAELKDHARHDLAGWITQADVERGNADALAGLVIFKRRGTADPGDQYVLMTVRDLAALLTGERP